MNRDALFATLADSVVSARPRMFGIYGTYRRCPELPLLGWGLEFPGGDGAIYRNLGESSVHLSDTAQRVLQVQSIIGDAHLTWL